MKANHTQIIFAREYRGRSQTELASQLNGISQSRLSKIEKGIESVSESDLQELSRVLNFPIDFFELEIYNKIYYANYRKKRITQIKKKALDMRLKAYGYLIDKMNCSYLDFPLMDLTSIDLMDGTTPEKAAQRIRKQMKLKDNPVKEICSLFEEHGIIVIEYDSDISEFDGVSYVTENGNYLIIINENMPNDRKRFTLAHELGHLIMHNTTDGMLFIDDFRDLEAEANIFAAEFLMPEDAIRSQLNGLKLQELAPLKKYWLTSMASILYRAQSLKCIDSKKSQYYNIEFSRKGYRKEEPVEVYIDKPSLYKDAYNLIKNEFNYAVEDMAQLFCFAVEDIKDLFGLNPRKGVRLKVNF